MGMSISPKTDMLSGTKIVGQLRKNSSGHATQIFAKKSRKFEIPAVKVKRFCKAVLVLLTCIKKHQYRLALDSFIMFSQLEFAKRR